MINIKLKLWLLYIKIYSFISIYYAALCNAPMLKSNKNSKNKKNIFILLFFCLFNYSLHMLQLAAAESFLNGLIMWEAGNGFHLRYERRKNIQSASLNANVENPDRISISIIIHPTKILRIRKKTYSVAKMRCLLERELLLRENYQGFRSKSTDTANAFLEECIE